MKSRWYEVKDFEWSVIPLLLRNKQRGAPVGDRKVVSGNLWQLRTR